MRTPRTGIYGWSTGRGGVHFFRIAEPLRVAREEGIPTADGNRMDDTIAEMVDTVLVHMLWDEPNSEAWEKLAHNGQHRLIFDIDDVMWDPDYQPFADHYTDDVLKRVWRNISLAHVVTTPSPVIAEYVSRYNPNVWYVPNTVPAYVTALQMGDRPLPAGRHGIDRLIGYQGSASHEGDIPQWLVGDIIEFLREHPQWGMHTWGCAEDHSLKALPLNVGCSPWRDSMREYYMSLSMDIGLGPLRDTAFNRGKSGLRAIEYAALGIVGILSAGPAYDPWVTHGETGFLVPPTRPWMWRDILRQLADEPHTMEKIRWQAREFASAFTTEANIGTWVEAWNSV